MEPDNDFVIERFRHIYEQYFDLIEIRTDGEGKRIIFCEYSHPRFKRTWAPMKFCGLPVTCKPVRRVAHAT